MASFYYSMAWNNGDWWLPTTFAFFKEIRRTQKSQQDSAAPSFLEVRSVWTRPNLLSARDGSLTGWHVGWTLNGSAGLAHKIYIHVEGFPDWAKGFQNEAALAKFLDTSFYANPSKYDTRVYEARLQRKDVPQAFVIHPEKFPTIMRDVNL